MWKQYRDTDYYLSPNGSIIRRYKKGDKPLKGYMHWKRNQHGNSYYVFKCYGSEVVLSRAIWETFKGEIPSGCLIIHKNGIKTMNNLDNLICVDKKKKLILHFGENMIVGTFTAWKKCESSDVANAVVIVKLRIPEDAKRSSATTNKCRADKVEVLGIETMDGVTLPDDFEAYSSRAFDFKYHKGDVLTVDDFDENRWNECAPGIHFFINRIDAVNY